MEISKPTWLDNNFSWVEEGDLDLSCGNGSRDEERIEDLGDREGGM